MTHNTSQAAVLARLFSASVFNELSKTGRSPMFARLLDQLQAIAPAAAPGTVAEVFENAFASLRKSEFRNEYVYRVAVAQRILMGRHSLKTASMLSEFRAGKSKADIVILNGTATVYEIKSERDTLARLSSQIADYKKVFAKVNVVCSEDHADGVLAQVPECVGVMKLARWNRISTLREGKDCAAETDPIFILDSLRASEAIALLKMLDRPVPLVPNTRLRAALAESFETLDPSLVHGAMVKILKSSRSLSSLADLIADVPVSLKAAALTRHIGKGDVARVVRALNTPIIEARLWA